MPTQPKKVVCPKCDSNRVAYHAKGELVCRECGHAWTRSLPDQGDLRARPVHSS